MQLLKYIVFFGEILNDYFISTCMDRIEQNVHTYIKWQWWSNVK